MLVQEVSVAGSGNQVGLSRCSDGRLELTVPFGMEGVAAPQAIALLYKAFVVFRSTGRLKERLASVDGVESQGQDGLDDGDDGFTFCDALGLDELFSTIDPTRILSLIEGRGRVSTDRHLRIDRHLHRALFDAQGVPYLDHVTAPRRELRYATGDIVGLYCFVAEDFYENLLGIAVETPWGKFSAEGKALSAQFRERYLSAGASQYKGEPDSCAHTLQTLRHTLLVIDRNTAFRSPDYRALHDTLDRFLNAGLDTKGKDGLVWGVKDFWAVWESVCLVRAATDHFPQFLTCDFDHLPVAASSPAAEAKWLAQRKAIFARNELARRPDLVLLSDTGAKVIDFKFYASAPTRRIKQTHGDVEKPERDFLNIESYGLLLQNHLLRTAPHLASGVTLELWLPGQSASQATWQHMPRWDPSLSIVTIPTLEALEQYSLIYELR
ncbi:hypothetical protein NX773_06485 [Massilia solisilvae]|uniref:LlaJI family restriction endonuclease n=1 Tax=Massilia solisilvae TaxID=1811225 RepID=A0ABT2BH26_9BURK|nr:hypothetical protein [Massilia solisilvae]MCS0607808.1 hypothetical protein [Massilia solisilvae]